MNRSLLILGAGGHGKDIGIKVLGHEVIDKISQCYLYSSKYTDAVVALGNNKVRLELTKKLKVLGYHIPILIHATSVVSKYANIKEGTVIMPQAVVNANSRIGMACIINTGAVVEHDCAVCDGAHIAYQAVLGGGAKVGNEILVDIGEIVGRNEERCTQR